MKTANLVLSLSLSLVAFSAQAATSKSTYVCTVPNDFRPFDTFVIELSDGPDADDLSARASIQYDRRATSVSEEFSLLLPLPGCEVAPYYRLSATDELHIECQPDGDTGAFTLDISNPQSILGNVVFWEENELEHEVEKEIALSCWQLN